MLLSRSGRLRAQPMLFGASALLVLAALPAACGDDACADAACATSAGGSGGQGGGGGGGLVCPPSGVYHGPWALRFDATSAVVRWDACAPGDVAITLEPEAGGAPVTVAGSQTAAEVTTEHFGLAGVPPDFAGTYYLSEVAVDGLTAGACYRYSVVADPERKGRFCTARASGESFGFMAIGDTNPAIANGKIQEIIDKVVLESPDFALHLGDIQYYSSILDSWSQWFISMQALLSSGAFEPSVGNHESENDTEYADYYGRLFEDAGFDGAGGYYRFQSGGLWFFSIDTEDAFGIGTTQGAWLETMLADAAQEPSFRASVVYMHRPFMTVGDSGSNPEWRAHYEPIFEQYGVRLVLASHMHGYERFVSGGVTYVVSGGGGGLIGNVDENVAARPEEAALRVASAAKFHAMMFDVSATGIQGRAIDETGAALDTFAIAIP